MATITTNPTNQSELQLYRVLERANLLSYYDSFIQQGGDDVQQLCEASEDEFLEIMALVGMSSKPLHVRRLQKALQEWVLNPEQFNVPLTSPPQQNLAIPLSLGLHPAGQGQGSRVSPQMTQVATDAQSNSSSSIKWANSPSLQQDQTMLLIPTQSGATMSTQMSSILGGSPQMLSTIGGSTQMLSTIGGSTQMLSVIGGGSTNSKTGQSQNHISLIDHIENPVLSADSLSCIKEAAEVIMAAEEPSTSPPPLNRKLMKELQHIFEMKLDDLNRAAELRKWSAIYGRFDSKRKSDKPLTLHEVTVNEASTQLCHLDPFLMAQREKLFPMARQVVRESGYRYKHGHSRKSNAHAVYYYQQGLLGNPSDGQTSLKCREEKIESVAKKPKLEPAPSYRDIDGSPNPRTVQAELMRIRREERMNEITSLLTTIKQSQSNCKASIVAAKSCDNLQQVYDLQIELEKLTTQQLLLMTEQTDLIKKQRRSDRYYVAKARAKDDNDEEALDFLGGGSEAGNFEDQDITDEIPEETRIDAGSMPLESTQATEIVPETDSSAQTTTKPKTPKKKSTNSTRVLLQNALMDEGLRIAQAYSNIEDPSPDDDRGSANLDRGDEGETKSVNGETKPVTNGVDESTNNDTDVTGNEVSNGVMNGTTTVDEESISKTDIDTRTESELVEDIKDGEKIALKSDEQFEESNEDQQQVVA